MAVKCLQPILVSQISVAVTSNVNVCENPLLIIDNATTGSTEIWEISKMSTVRTYHERVHINFKKSQISPNIYIHKVQQIYLLRQSTVVQRLG